MNIPLLRKIQAQIIQHPETLFMPEWDCGTKACIAGWACRLEGKSYSNGSQCFQDAKALLDLSHDQCALLFSDANWPSRFCSGARLSKAYAKATVARIDHFIFTGGAE